MRFVLLLGAGFSRNWGGWLASEVFDYLMGCKAVREDGELKSILLQHKTSFEDALARVQASFLGSETTDTAKRLEVLQGALLDMFMDMDTGFQKAPFEFQSDIAYLVRTFMIHFDAIFSLNQDSLLERHYLDGNVELGAARKWNGWQLPGMQPVPDPTQMPFDGLLKQWRPRGPEGFVVAKRLQPCFKMHGSMNWMSTTGGPVLVMGANKVGGLAGHPVLRWYFDQFKTYLSGPARLMAIGYSFRDHHINKVIMDAIKRNGLELFVIDPLGAEAIGQGNSSRGGAIYARSEMEDILEDGLIGVSKRSLREIFGHDHAEHAKVMRFFRS